MGRVAKIAHRMRCKMKFAKIASVLFILSFILVGICSADEGKGFPKIGFVKNNGANVRAGDNINFESLCKLEKGDPVKIIGKRYSWFKIILPKKAHVYIKSDYVDVDSEGGIEGTGVVNALRVNLRAGPGTKYSILGQVSKPEILNILSESDGWYRIEPLRRISGWMHSSQLMFSLGEIKDLK